MSWREIHGDQNLRMAAKMLEQQGKINDLEAEVSELGLAVAAEYDGFVADLKAADKARIAELERQRSEVLAYLGFAAESHDAGACLTLGDTQPCGCDWASLITNDIRAILAPKEGQ